jgi:squalene-associated FAD-dependent desaturase
MSAATAVVGAGWAGLAAAVAAVEVGERVTLFEMAPQAGGRARSLPADAGDPRLDNGQHILIGAYTATLGLMRRVGVDPEAVLLRTPLALLDQDGLGLRLPQGHPVIAFTRAVWAMRHWSLRERLALSNAAAGWMLRRFRCDAALTVAQLTATLPPRVRAEIIDPLCVAALNTPADAASAAVFLRVLHDALFSGPGASDLLIPRRPLAELLPEPALHWLDTHGATLRIGQRVQRLAVRTDGSGWTVDDAPFDRVVLACSASEAARLTRDIAPAWSASAAAFGYEPIVTGYVQAANARLAAPMVALAEGPQAPAQFAFDHGALGMTTGLFAFVVSGAAPWVAQGMDATGAALLAQARSVLRGAGAADAALVKLVAEKRATFRCVPSLQRPATQIAAGLSAAGDYLDGPYPATIEGAVRSVQPMY